MTDSTTTATAEERLAAVERFAREVDWPERDHARPVAYSCGYEDGYAAARGELRALLGIEGE